MPVEQQHIGVPAANYLRLIVNNPDTRPGTRLPDGMEDISANLARVYQVEHTIRFDHLVTAIDEADDKLANARAAVGVVSDLKECELRRPADD